MGSPLIPQGFIDQSPNQAQSLISSSCAYRPSLLSRRGLSIPVSHDENAHHVVPCNPYLVPPTPSKDKLSPSTKNLYGCDPVPPNLKASYLHRSKTLLAKATCPIAKKTCRACAVPNRYFVHCHELLPKFLSQINTSSDVLRESDLLQETVSDVSEYMFHEANNPIDSGYHSPQPMVPVHRDASNNSVSMVPVSTNKVPCPFPKDGTLVDLPCNKDKVTSPVLCKAMGCPDVKFPGQVLPLASTPRVSRENLTNTGSIFAPSGKSEIFAKPNYPIPCNCIVGPIEEKVLPPLIGFPAQSVIKLSCEPKPTVPPDETLNCPRLVLMAKDQPQYEILATQSQMVHSNQITRNQLGCPPPQTHSIPKDSHSKGGGGNTNGIL